MNNNQTIEKLKELRLDAMAELHLQHIEDTRINTTTADQYLGLLTDHQWERNQNRKIERLLKLANFNENATIAAMNFTQQRNLDRNLFDRLATLSFIKRKENVIVTGASGVGKSYIAQALAHQACINQHKTLYHNTASLLKKLKISMIDGTYLKELAKLVKTDLLILDDFGLQGFDKQSREALMDIIGDRHNKKSTIVASQIPVSKWHELIGEKTIADAILDRIVNSSHRVDLKGESLRKNALRNV